jgi:hypothetical protein
VQLLLRLESPEHNLYAHSIRGKIALMFKTSTVLGV